MPVVTNGPPMHLVAGWIISGLWIDFGDVRLHAYNGVDADGLPAERAQPGYENAFHTVKSAIALCVTACAEPEREKCGMSGCR